MKWCVWSRGGWHIGGWCGNGLFDEVEYHRQKKGFEWEFESLLAPEVDAAKEAGRLLVDMPRLCAGTTLQKRHRLLKTILDAVYINLKGSKSIVSVKAKPAFQAVLGMATPNWDLSTTLAAR